jgi:hypothetical protein
MSVRALASCEWICKNIEAAGLLTKRKQREESGKVHLTIKIKSEILFDISVSQSTKRLLILEKYLNLLLSRTKSTKN